MCCVVFFFKQKTAYEFRISDWSSDVCSSDLNRSPKVDLIAGVHGQYFSLSESFVPIEPRAGLKWRVNGKSSLNFGDRKRVVKGKSVSVGVDIGGCRIFKKTKN